MENKKNYVKEKLNIAEVLGDSLHLYKNNFTLFLKLSFALFLLNVISFSFSNVSNLIENSLSKIMYSFFNFILIFVFSYYLIKLYISLLICIAYRYDRKEIGIKESYNKAQKVVWKNIGASIIFGLIIFIPLTGLILSYMFINNVVAKLLLVVLFLILSMYLSIIYFFGPIIRVFEPQVENYFKRSKSITKNYFYRILLLLVIGYIFMLPNIVFRNFIIDVKEFSVLQNYIYNIINYCINLFSQPFTCSIIVIMFYRLKSK